MLFSLTSNCWFLLPRCLPVDTFFYDSSIVPNTTKLGENMVTSLLETYAQQPFEPNQIKISNVVLTGYDPFTPCAGYYTGAKALVPDITNSYGVTTNFPDSGIVLSSGTAYALNDRNYPDNARGAPGDADLTRIANWTGNVTGTFSACILEFDFTADCDTVVMEYVFASDEYDAYVFTGMHDVFGFFLNGTNTAVLPPGYTFPADATSINADSNYKAWYFDNVNGSFPNFRPNGFTTNISLTLHLNPNHDQGPVLSTSHFKIGIANTNEDTHSSWVFIREKSFRCVNITPPVLCTFPHSTIPSVPICKKHIKTNEVIGSSGISKPPFTIVDRNTSTVTFTVDVNWTEYKSVYIQYFDLHQEQYECINLCNKPDNFTITAHCLKTVPIAVIEIWL